MEKIEENEELLYKIEKLHALIRHKNEYELKLLLENIKDPNVLNEDGMSPLYTAVVFANLKIMRLLLLYNSDPNISDTHGYTPLHVAALFGKLKKINLLLQDDRTDPNIKNNKGDTALHIATRNGDLEMVEAILNNEKTKVNIRNKEEKTALDIARELEGPVAERLRSLIQTAMKREQRGLMGALSEMGSFLSQRDWGCNVC